ncbi:hypothetical protein [Corallococcus llansteffanensis]|uniref:Uncharacterized protein n=1 Tax=Corallococcus llansteffanensis TaxID=2316731 RepID=A0A3A8PV51_9BACT|nr:hypothetical protein [Corallococcus llansteffanensis]RKH60347.1 hypothetical protein D7V93_13465 [Corallococcus llansteffanensis]
MDLKSSDVLIQKPERGGVLLRSALGLALAGGIAWSSMPSIDPWAVGLAVLVVLWGLDSWFSTKRIPVFVGPLEAVQAVEGFVHAAKSKLQEPVKPAAPLAPTPSELVSAIKRARGPGAEAENIRCYVRGRHATGGAEARGLYRRLVERQALAL